MFETTQDMAYAGARREEELDAEVSKHRHNYIENVAKALMQDILVDDAAPILLKTALREDDFRSLYFVKTKEAHYLQFLSPFRNFVIRRGETTLDPEMILPIYSGDNDELSDELRNICDEGVPYSSSRDIADYLSSYVLKAINPTLVEDFLETSARDNTSCVPINETIDIFITDTEKRISAAKEGKEEAVCIFEEGKLAALNELKGVLA